MSVPDNRPSAWRYLGTLVAWFVVLLLVFAAAALL